MRKAGVRVHLRPYNTIRSHLVHPKDKIKKEDKAGYKIECSECEAKYVGETEWTLKKRITEHHRNSYPVGHHMEYQRHFFSHGMLNSTQSIISLLKMSEWRTKSLRGSNAEWRNPYTSCLRIHLWTGTGSGTCFLPYTVKYSPTSHVTPPQIRDHVTLHLSLADEDGGIVIESFSLLYIMLWVPVN